jgi:MinD-like ATPase involved in chromosome partitioning or flagellar assembly
MSKVKHKIAVISGKGGVGKRTATVNVAAAFVRCNQSSFALLGMDLTFK